MNWEVGTDVHVLPVVKQIARGNLLYRVGSSAEGKMLGGRSKREGIHVYV